MIQFHCPVCNRLLETADGTTGAKFACPVCNQRIEVPAPRPDAGKTVLGKLPDSGTPAPEPPIPTLRPLIFDASRRDPPVDLDDRCDRSRRDDDRGDDEGRRHRRRRDDDDHHDRRNYDDDNDRGRRRRRSADFFCPYCDSTELPREEEQISQEGWILFTVLLAGGLVFGLCGGVLCFPLAVFLLAPLLCWLPLILMKKKSQICYDCGRKVA